MYCQDIFDHPVCIMKSRPTLIRHYYADDKILSRNTGCSLIVYLQPRNNIEEATQEFVDIYSEKGQHYWCRLFSLARIRYVCPQR